MAWVGDRGPSHLLGVATQHPKEGGNLLKVPQCILGFGICQAACNIADRSRGKASACYGALHNCHGRFKQAIAGEPNASDAKSKNNTPMHPSPALISTTNL